MSAPRAGLPRAAWLATGAALAAGGAQVGADPTMVLAMGLAMLAAAAAGRTPSRGRQGRPSSWTRAPIALGAGIIVISLRLLAGPSAGDPPALGAVSGGPWLAEIEAVGSPRNGSQTARLRLRTGDGSVAVAATLPAYPEVAAGALVEVRGRLRPPPDDDPYGDYLRRTGTAGTLAANAMRVLAAPPSTSLMTLRDGAGDALQRALPEPEAGLAAGILIGLRERVDRDLAAAFATAGVSHVVAISGWNIAIVAGIVGAMLRGRGRRLIAIVVGMTIGAYVIAAGASPSVVRAAVMASVVLIARESGRAGRAPAALAWAVVILLLAAPEMVADAGFRLSVLATAGLLAWANPIGAWIGRRAGGRVPRWLAESLGISLAAQAATLPDVLATFGRLSLVAPVVNLLVVPLVPAAMAGGVVALLGGLLVTLGAPAWLATLVGLPGWLLLHLMVWIVRAGASLPYAAVALPPDLALPAGLTAAAGLAAVVLWRHADAGRRWRRRRATPRSAMDRRPGTAATPGSAKRTPTPSRDARWRRTVLVGLVITIAIASAAVAQAASRETRVVVLDIGQGDAILVESRGGARMLVDGGPDPARLLTELDAWIAPWDRRIDVIVLTHPHEDHVAGLVRVLDRYTVGRVYENGMHGPGPAWSAWDARLATGPPRGLLATGGQITLGEISMRVLWPDPGTVPIEPPDTGAAINDRSIVLLGEANGRRFLLTGDAEEDVDPVLLTRGLPQVDLLKVAHHGSATATTAGLLDATRPAVAVISVGADNRYGHPAPATVARLREAGAAVYRTDQDGSVEVDLRPDGLAVHASGGRSAAVPAIGLGYDPSRDHPDPTRGRGPAALPPGARMVPAPFVRRGGRRRLAGRGGSSPRTVGGRRSRRGGRAAARRRQAVGGHGPGPPPARRGIGRMARGPWLAGAWPARRGTPGHPDGGSGVLIVGSVRVAGGADRRLRGQARRTAAGSHGRSVRVMAPPIPVGAVRERAGRGLGRFGGRAGAGARRRPRTRGLCGGRSPPRGCAPPPLVEARAPGALRVSDDIPILAYYRGDDGWALDRAAGAVGTRLERDAGLAPERWRVTGAETSAAAIAEHVATTPMFGGGTVAIVVDPAPLLRSKAEREALEQAVRSVAPGNALVFIEQGDPGSRRSAALQGLEGAVRAAGGEAKAFRAPREGELAAWLQARAAERGLALAPAAARELARRVGAFVREGDVDRQRQGALAVAELDKLALYRPGGEIGEEDVRALVAEVVPDSTWAALDAVADRRAAVAGPLLDRLLETVPEPVVLVQLHRRLRELVIAADHVASRGTPAQLVKLIGGHPFRSQKLAQQAAHWTLPELERALDGLLELDAMVKGAPGFGTTVEQRRLAFTLWVRDRVAAGTRGTPARTR